MTHTTDANIPATAELGKIHGAVINAGVAGAGQIADLEFSEWRRVLAVNLDGAFLTMRAALRSIRSGGSSDDTSSTGSRAVSPARWISPTAVLAWA